MEENLIGYLLDALDEPTRRQVEGELERNPCLQDKLAQLKQALAPLAADQDSAAPPPMLAVRTLAAIAEHVCTSPPAVGIGNLPQAPAVSRTALPMARTWWRRVDVLVAACLLLMAAGIGTTVLAKIRVTGSSAMIVNCKNNLRQFFTALQQYRDMHGRFPDISREYPRNVAGMVVPILIEAGTLPEDVPIRCPGSTMEMSSQLTMATLRNMSDADFKRCSPCLSMFYAYSLGYRDEEGALHAPGTNLEVGLTHQPIMADRPPTEGLVKNSMNHDGAGQNVLFSDGHLVFFQTRTLDNGDDMFMNRELKVAAGVDSGDVVLGYSAARP